MPRKAKNISTNYKICACCKGAAAKYKWCKNSLGYFRATIAPKTRLFLHHFVLQQHVIKFKNKDVDHIDRDPSNNNIKNLRVVRHQINSYNRGLFKNNTSGFKGVGYVKHNLKNPWVARIKVNGVLIHLGYFKSKEEASKCYDNKLLQQMEE